MSIVKLVIGIAKLVILGIANLSTSDEHSKIGDTHSQTGDIRDSKSVNQ